MVLEAGADGIEVVRDAAGVGVVNVAVEPADQGSGDHGLGAERGQENDGQEQEGDYRGHGSNSSPANIQPKLAVLTRCDKILPWL